MRAFLLCIHVYQYLPTCELLAGLLTMCRNMLHTCPENAQRQKYRHVPHALIKKASLHLWYPSRHRKARFIYPVLDHSFYSTVLFHSFFSFRIDTCIWALCDKVTSGYNLRALSTEASSSFKTGSLVRPIFLPLFSLCFLAIQSKLVQLCACKHNALNNFPFLHFPSLSILLKLWIVLEICCKKKSTKHTLQLHKDVYYCY